MQRREKFTFPKFLKHCSPILLVQVGWKQGKVLGSTAGNSVVESGRLGLWGRGKNLYIWAKICFWETFGREFNLFERAAFWQIFSSWFLEGCIRIIQCDVYFVNTLSVYPRRERTHLKSVSNFECHITFQMHADFQPVHRFSNTQNLVSYSNVQLHVLRVVCLCHCVLL